VLVAIGVDWEGRRNVLGVELANRESGTSWKDFLRELKERGLKDVEFVVSDDHEGLKRAIREVLPAAAWQRCYVGLLKNQSLPDSIGLGRCRGGDRDARTAGAATARVLRLRLAA
jgi:putative transposase